MSLFFDKSFDQNDGIVHIDRVNEEQMPKRGWTFINVTQALQPVAKKKMYDDDDNVRTVEQWHHPQAARRRNNLNISPGEITERESFTKTTSMKWVRENFVLEKE